LKNAVDLAINFMMQASCAYKQGNLLKFRITNSTQLNDIKKKSKPGQKILSHVIGQCLNDDCLSLETFNKILKVKEQGKLDEYLKNNNDKLMAIFKSEFKLISI
jgi:hypothetical protein